MMINVAFCIDDNFAPYAAVSLVSLLSNTKSFVTIYVIGNLSEEVKDKLASLKNDEAKIIFVNHDISIPCKALSARYMERLNEVTFVRYAIAEILVMLDKVIYLDADILVCGDIRDLWEQPLNKSYVGAVLDHSLMSQQRQRFLGLKSKSYFNAGVLLIDLKMWREMNIFQHLNRIHDTRDVWEYNDQDVLNVVLDEKVQYVAAGMNAQTYSLKHLDIAAPTIIHFTGQEKPWHLSSVHPYKDQYRALLAAVPFKANGLTLFLDKQDRIILTRLNSACLSGGNIVIWGAGARGRRIIMALQRDYPQFVIRQVVDSYFKGTCLSFTVAPPEKILTEKIDAVVIATLPQKQDIANFLRHKTLTVI
ncbi:hypothetical protein BM524_04555 [Alteromonas mediterranea]|uniref:Glycosyl transferase n=1 Tax=Alteromonas mediterranea TaxID=314275 RepID=A0AAC9J8K0_9ALTE|nr:glycosyltransferase family 8 protein [Alteromonas mediterranea]APD89139.1 hypothetical protein BM524_04555 [Alteromonas mediterranea]